MALTPQQSEHLEVLQTIERLGGSATYEKHLSKSSHTPAKSVPSFPNCDPVYTKIKFTRLIGGTGGWSKVTLMSGDSGQYHAELEFWSDEAPSESAAGGYFNYQDWDFLVKNEVSFTVEGAQHFDSATITFSNMDAIIGRIYLIGSWPLAGVEIAYGTCQWKLLLQAQPLGQKDATLKLIKEVEEIGGSKEYVRSLTNESIPEIPDYSKWHHTVCSVKNDQIGVLHTCTITDNALDLATVIKTFVPLVPNAPAAKVFIKHGVKLAGQKCGWFVTSDVHKQKFIIPFYSGTAGNIIAVVEGPGRNVRNHPGGAKVTWIPIN